MARVSRRELVVIEAPRTEYAQAGDGAYLAYQVCGAGPPDILLVPGGGSHVEAAWEVPPFADGFRRLASFSRLIRYDPAGSGLSDPLGRGEQPSLEARAAEIIAVMDAVGSKRATLVANNSGGLVAIFFAASYPERTASLVLDGCYARLARASDYPWGIPVEILEEEVVRNGSRTTRDPIDSTGLRYTAPHSIRDPEFLTAARRYYRTADTPSGVSREGRVGAFSDVRALLPAVQVPTLVLHRTGDLLAGRPHAAYLAAHIADSTLVEVPGEDNLMFVGNDGADFDEIEEFLTGARRAPPTDRILATVLFTDIVGSTERAAELGDRKWREVIDSHDRAVRRQLERFRGREIHTTGDGFLSTFDGPGRAIECACAIRDVARGMGLEIRAGLHTGEIEVLGPDVAGLAVHIGARIAALADAGEVLVSSTVKDLVVGSGLEFSDRGDHELRGVPGTWRLFRVEP